jgi:outer membrane protein TolC
MLPQGRVFRCWMLAATMLGGCARVGPDFQPQHETWSGQWTSEAIGQASEAGAQPDMRQWWQVFNDPVLEHLITEADANDAGVRIAGLRVMEARAQLGMALAGRYPQMQQAGADAMYVHSRQSGPTAQTARVWEYSAGVDVGWELDFWGNSPGRSSPPMPRTSRPRRITRTYWYCFTHNSRRPITHCAPRRPACG